MRIFFDTNVLAYQFDDSDPVKQGRAREIFAQHAESAVISTQVMIELHAVLTRKLGVSKTEAGRVLDALDIDVVAADAALVRRGAHLAAQRQLSIFDALIVEAAVDAGANELWTEDLRDESTVRGIRIVNPFATAE